MGRRIGGEVTRRNGTRRISCEDGRRRKGISVVAALVRGSKSQSVDIQPPGKLCMTTLIQGSVAWASARSLK